MKAGTNEVSLHRQPCGTEGTGDRVACSPGRKRWKISGRSVSEAEGARLVWSRKAKRARLGGGGELIWFVLFGLSRFFRSSNQINQMN